MREPTPTDDHGREVHGRILALCLVVQREAAERVCETKTTSSDAHLGNNIDHVPNVSYLNCSPLNGKTSDMGTLILWQLKTHKMERYTNEIFNPKYVPNLCAFVHVYTARCVSLADGTVVNKIGMNGSYMNKDKDKEV